MIQYQNNNKQITFSVKVLHFNTIQLPGTVFDLFTGGIKLCEVESNYSVFSSFLFIDVILIHVYCLFCLQKQPW